MRRRIYGIETEFGITCVDQGQRTLTPDEVARYLFRKVVSWGRSSNVFLSNGSRLYLDVGSHPEYATAECDDLLDLVAHDKAGERILNDLVLDATERLAEDGIAGDIYVFKNNTDSAGNSYGCHENYLIGRGGEFHDFSEVLIPFLVSRQLIAGAGKVIPTPKGATYSLSHGGHQSNDRGSGSRPPRWRSVAAACCGIGAGPPAASDRGADRAGFRGGVWTASSRRWAIGRGFVVMRLAAALSWAATVSLGMVSRLVSTARLSSQVLSGRAAARSRAVSSASAEAVVRVW